MCETAALLRQIAADVAAIRAHLMPTLPPAAEMPAWLRNTLFSDPASLASAPALHSASAQPAPTSHAPDRLSVGLGGQI